MSGAKCTPITSSFRPASWPKACSSISRSSPPSWFGTRSDRGCAPFVPASRRQNSSSPTRCATCFPIFSSVPQKTVPSQNSSPIAKTQQTCKDFAWHHEKKPALLRFIDRQLYCDGGAWGGVGGGLPEGPSARCAPAVHKSTG